MHFESQSKMRLISKGKMLKASNLKVNVMATLIVFHQIK